MRLAIAAVVVLGVALTLLAASGGVRGSDQYWYLADVETLVTEGSATTNTHLPAALLGPEPASPPPFIHNVLSIYLAAIPAAILGPFNGWIALNLIATLAASACIYLAARHVARPWAAVLCALAYPLLPIALWHTAQPLAEASTSLFAALGIWLLARAGVSALQWLGVVVAVGLLYMSRQSYLPLLAIVPVAFLVLRVREHPDGLRGALLPTVLLGLAAAPFVVGAGSLFGAENVNFSYTRLLHAAVPGQTDNMWFNFDLSPDNLEDRLPLELGLIVPKLTGHIAEQFVQFGSVPVAVFYWTFNLLTLVAVAALVRERDPLRVRLIVAALALVAIHLVTIVLFQNQFRYTVPALPGLLVVLAMVVSDWSWLDRFASARPVFAVLVLALLATGPNLYLARDLRDDGQASADVEASVVAMFDRHLATNQPLLVVYVGPPQILVYAARPRPVLYLAAYYSRAEIDRLRRAFSADWLLAPSGSAVVTALGLTSDSAVATVQALGEQWGLFELPPPTE